jgi:hypothetical protein
MLPEVETVETLFDIADRVPHQFILQARNFVKSDANPRMYYSVIAQNLPTLKDTVDGKEAFRLLNFAEIKYINLIAALLKMAENKRAEGNTKATKPIELYRMYHKDIRRIWKRGGQMALVAQELYQDLYLKQTYSEGELNSPDYVDGYTGKPEFETVQDFEKAIPEQHAPGLDELLKFVDMAPDPESDGFDGLAPVATINRGRAELLRQANEYMRDELGYDPGTIERFIAVNSEGFDAENDEELVVDDNTDDYTPPPLLKDFEIDDVTWERIAPAVGRFNYARNRAFEKCSKKHLSREDTVAHFKKYVLSDSRLASIRSDLWFAAQEHPTTAAVAFLKMSTDYGVKEEYIHHFKVDEDFCLNDKDIAGIGIRHPSRTLLKFVSEFFNDLMEMVQTPALFKYNDTEAWKAIDEFAAQTMDMLRRTMPVYHPNPMKTAAWNIGFMRAAMGHTEWKQAEDAAWANWRFEMDPAAAKKYDQALASDDNRFKAMRVFWNACNKKVPHPKDKILNVDKSRNGVNLESKRFINWQLLATKIKAGEIDFSGDTVDAEYVRNLREDARRLNLSEETVQWIMKQAGVKEPPTLPANTRLLNLLKQLDCGQAVWDLLETPEPAPVQETVIHIAGDNMDDGCFIPQNLIAEDEERLQVQTQLAIQPSVFELF